jgi:hypothetical protein
MARRSRRTRLAKTHRCYTIAGAAELYGCHRNTVRLWMRKGLEPIEPTRPFLIHGSTLNAFHATRRKKAKRPCQPGEIYCLPCRKPQRPHKGLFDYLPITPTTGKVTANCPDCGRLMHQRVNRSRLAAFEAKAQSNHAGTMATK